MLRFLSNCWGKGGIESATMWTYCEIPGHISAEITVSGMGCGTFLCASFCISNCVNTSKEETYKMTVQIQTLGRI